MVKKILYISNTRLDYSLNSVLIKGLRENGVDVVDFKINKGIPGLVKAGVFYKDNSKNVDLVIVGYNSQQLVPWLKLVSRNKVVFNAVLSEYERMIISRQMANPFSLKGVYYWFKDFVAVHCADLILVESDKQANFFNRIFKVSKQKLYRNWIGADEGRFYYDETIPKAQVFTVLFRGALMPEAGVEHVIKAAKLLEDKNINFILLIGGLLMEETEKLIKDLEPRNLKYMTEYFSYEDLRKIMQSCHISLGQLSDHVRLTRTLPHKLYETLSMKLPYLTANNAGALELLTPDDTCLTCSPADSNSLAEKILWIRDNYHVAEKVAESGYQLFNDKLRSKALGRGLLDRINVLFS